MTKLDAALAAKLCAEAMEDVCPCCDGAGERAYAQHDPEIPRWGTCVDCDGFGIRTRPAPLRALAEQLMAALEAVKERDETIELFRLADTDALAERDAALREVERMRAVYEAAAKWRRAKLGGGWLVGADADLASTLDAAHVSRERAKEGSK